MGFRRIGGVSRADLLLKFELGLMTDESTWFELPNGGYQRRLPNEGRARLVTKRPIITGGDQTSRPPLRVPRLWRIEEHIADHAPSPTPKPPPVESTNTIELIREARPPRDMANTTAKQVWAHNAASTIRQTRATLAGIFKASENVCGTRTVDWRAVTHRLARLMPLLPLPHRPPRRSPVNLVLLLDRRSQTLNPFVFDMDHLVGNLRRWIGHRAVEVRVVADEPAALWQPWETPSRESTPAPRAEWQRLFGAWVLVVSDFSLATEAAHKPEQWNDWLKARQHQSCRVIGLTPLLPKHAVHLPALDHALLWRQGSASVLVRAGGRAPGQVTSLDWQNLPPAVADLLALVAWVGEVSDVELRAYRQVLAPSGDDLAVEWLVWNHPHVQNIGRYCHIREEHRAQHEARIGNLPPQLLRRVYQARRELGAALPEWDEHLAVLRAASLAPAFAEQIEADCALARHALFVDLPAQIRVTTEAALPHASRIAQILIKNAHPAVLTAFDHAFRQLQSLAFGEALKRGESIPVYETLGMVDDPSMPASTDNISWQLIQQGAALKLIVEGEIKANHHVLRAPFGDADGPGSVTVRADAREVSVPISTPEARLADLNAVKQVVELKRGHAVARIDAVPRPAWARGWGQDRSGLFADLAVGSVTQRLRYLPPGSFLMGSPETEAGRYDDEGPQHVVTLTAGFWLADTPCTQAFWETVMGTNPSHFKKNKNAGTLPVEQVTWDMVCGAETDGKTSFMAKLQALLNVETTANLPSEAEWEYACRAGTKTAYWWGDEADVKRANMGDNTQQTTPVKQFAANPWGLYDIHGNVWEWCRDFAGDGELRAYPMGAESDPEGLQEGSYRVLRGGAWSYGAANARAAYRHHVPRGNDWLDYGFRFALRSRAPGGPSVGGAD